MSDNLTILGEDYTGVTGIKATDTSSGNTLIFVRPQGTKSITANGTGIDVAAYATADVSVSVSPNLQTKTVAPTESLQAIEADSGYDGLAEVDVSAIPNNYVGSGISRQAYNALYMDSDPTMIIAPSGYYSEDGEYYLGDATATPSATKGTVSNHSVSVTPSVTKTAGYLTAGTTSGTAVSVSASELVSGTKSITANGTGIDVTDYAAVDVAVPSSAPNLQAKTNIAPTTSSQTITADSGYDGLSSVQINAMPTQSLPTAASNTASGTRKATIASSTSTQYINIPTGYNSAAAYYQLSAPTAMTLPTTASSTSSGTRKAIIASSTSTQYINIPTGYNSEAAYYQLSASSGTSKNAQTAQSTTRSTSTSGTSVISLTCTKAGTYDVYWTTFRSSTSGTWGSRLYIGGTAYETMQTGSWSNHIQNRHVSNVSIAANETVAVYVQSRGSNYYGYVGTLTIIES